MEGGPPSFPRATSCPVVLAVKAPLPIGFRLRGSHPLRPTLPGPSPIPMVRVGGRQTALALRTTPSPQRLPAYTARVWAAPVSLAATRGMISFPRGTEMFQFPHLPPERLCVQRPVTGVSPAGLPHSGIDDALPACGPSSLFAACHALLRP